MFITSKYRAANKSAQDNAPPGWPLPALLTDVITSFLISPAFSSSCLISLILIPLYPFTAPAVIPVMRFFEHAKVTINAGIAIMVAIAIICPQLIPRSLIISDTAAGSVLVLRLLKIIARRNSFHAVRNVKTLVTEIPGLISGTTIPQRILI